MAPPNYNSNDSSAFSHIFNPISIGGYNIYTGACLNLFFGFFEFLRAKNCVSGWLIAKKKVTNPDRKLSVPSIKTSLIICCWIVASQRHWSGKQINNHSWIKSSNAISCKKQTYQRITYVSEGHLCNIFTYLSYYL